MRTDLIEDLESVVRLLNDGGWDADVRVVQEAISALESMKWIPVSERLPEAMGYVLVAEKDGFVTEGDYMPSIQEFFADDGHHIHEVTHWMPKPTPPKVEQEE